MHLSSRPWISWQGSGPAPESQRTTKTRTRQQHISHELSGTYVFVCSYGSHHTLVDDMILGLESPDCAGEG